MQSSVSSAVSSTSGEEMPSMPRWNRSAEVRAPRPRRSSGVAAAAQTETAEGRRTSTDDAEPAPRAGRASRGGSRSSATAPASGTASSSGSTQSSTELM